MLSRLCLCRFRRGQCWLPWFRLGVAWLPRCGGGLAYPFPTCQFSGFHYNFGMILAVPRSTFPASLSCFTDNFDSPEFRSAFLLDVAILVVAWLCLPIIWWLILDLGGADVIPFFLLTHDLGGAASFSHRSLS